MASSSFTFKQFNIYQEKCSFKVGTDGVLLGAYTDINGIRTILDIGTGTGLIALMLAQRSEAEITAIEPDRNSFEQACDNIRRSKWSDRIQVINTDLQNYRPGTSGFDLIVSNPPYFVDSLPNPDPGKAAARHNITLDRQELLRGISELLVENGRFQVILPYPDGNIFIAEAQSYGFYCYDILKIKPLPTSEVRRMILGFSGRRQERKEKFLTIEHGPRHDFTKEYIRLTKDFYLRF